MTSTMTDERRLVSQSVERFIAERYEFNTRRGIVAEDPGFLAEHWAQFAELGWLALPFAEADGGLGGGIRDVTLIAEGLGRGLFVGPFSSSVVLAGGVVARAGTDEQKEALLGPLMSGESHLALAFAEPQSRYDLTDVLTRATSEGGHYRLSGQKSVVLFAASASRLIVSARTRGGQTDSDGVSLFIVEPDGPGVSLRPYTTVDGLRGAEVFLDEASGVLLGPLHGGGPVLEAACDIGCVVLAAEAVGCMGHLYESTLDYIKQREQFGATLGSFQAIQHRMVDVFMSYEQARSLTYATAERLDGGTSDGERARLASAVKFEVAKAGRHIGQEAVQLHGGMGMTDELSIGHYFKRLTAINATLGDRHHHLQRFRRLEGEG